MFTFNNRPPKRRASKPVAKAATQPRKSENHLGTLNDPFFLFFVSWMALIVASILLRSVAGTPPAAQIGDMLEFTVNSASVTAPTTAVPAQLVSGPWASPARGCTLDVATMIKPGGTLTVMALRPDGVMLSWAGGITAYGTADCRSTDQKLTSDAGYLVSDTGYERLSKAVVQNN
jgi:hypothetical protein